MSFDFWTEGDDIERSIAYSDYIILFMERSAPYTHFINEVVLWRFLIKMSNIFHSAGANLRRSPYIIPLYLIVLLGFVIACGIAIEDYSTSLLGYNAIPTQKANNWVIPLVAALPQVAQVILFYVFLQDTRNKITLILAILIHIVDVGTDMYYKSYEFKSFSLSVMAFAESEIIYTLGSEALLTLTFGLLIDSLDDFGTQFVKTLQSTSAFLRNLLGKDDSPGAPRQMTQAPRGVDSRLIRTQQKQQEQMRKARSPFDE